LPPEFVFAYTVLKNSGYLNLVDAESPVSPSSVDINLPKMKPSHPSKNIQEETSVSFVRDNEIISPNVKTTDPIMIFKKKLLTII
jgi:hypothetical protein